MGEDLGSILRSPFPGESSPPLPLGKTAKGGTSSLWNCFEVGCAQEAAEATMAAPNLQLRETGWEKSPDGVVSSLEKGQEPFGYRWIYKETTRELAKCTRKWVSNRGEPVPCLAGKQDSNGPVFVLLQLCQEAVLQQSCNAFMVREAKPAGASFHSHSSAHPSKPAHTIFDKDPAPVLCYLHNSLPCTSLTSTAIAAHQGQSTWVCTKIRCR